MKRSRLYVIEEKMKRKHRSQEQTRKWNDRDMSLLLRKHAGSLWDASAVASAASSCLAPWFSSFRYFKDSTGSSRQSGVSKLFETCTDLLCLCDLIKLFFSMRLVEPMPAKICVCLTKYQTAGKTAE